MADSFRSPLSIFDQVPYPITFLYPITSGTTPPRLLVHTGPRPRSTACRMSHTHARARAHTHTHTHTHTDTRTRTHAHTCTHTHTHTRPQSTAAWVIHQISLRPAWVSEITYPHVPTSSDHVPLHLITPTSYDHVPSRPRIESHPHII